MEAVSGCRHLEEAAVVSFCTNSSIICKHSHLNTLLTFAVGREDVVVPLNLILRGSKSPGPKAWVLDMAMSIHIIHITSSAPYTSTQGFLLSPHLKELFFFSK